jgi:hypothetical protein
VRLRLRNGRENGWGRWIRTTGMTESKSVALPLGYTPSKAIYRDAIKAGRSKNGGRGWI